MMPSSYTLEKLPQPEDPKVTLRQVPARRMATVRYSGCWSEKGYLRQKYVKRIERWIGATTDPAGFIVHFPVPDRFTAVFGCANWLFCRFFDVEHPFHALRPGRRCTAFGRQ
jgi:hypothetical protein